MDLVSFWPSGTWTGFPGEPYFRWRNAVSPDIRRRLLGLCEKSQINEKYIYKRGKISPFERRSATHPPQQSEWWRLCWTARLLYCCRLPPSLRKEWAGGTSRLCTCTWWSLPRSPSSPSSLWFHWPERQRCTRSPRRSGTPPTQAGNIGQVILVGFRKNLFRVC